MALLKATARTTRGTRKSRALRAKNQIPGIIYGHGKTPEPVTLDQHEVQLLVSHGERLLEIDIDGQKQNALVKEVQYDPMGNEVLHIDLARVDLDERVEVTVAVRLRGTPAAPPRAACSSRPSPRSASSARCGTSPRTSASTSMR